MSQDNKKLDDSETQLKQELLQFLVPEEREQLLQNAKKITLKKNQILMHQGDPADSFFIVLKGKLRATKHVKKKTIEHLMGYLRGGEIIGEMAIIENVPRTVTLKATQSTTVLEFKIDQIQQFPEIYNKLSIFLGKRTAQRLRYLTDVTVKSMEKELQEAKKHNALGLLMVTVFSLICVYMISQRFLENLAIKLPVTTIISAPMVIIIVVIMVWVMKKSGYPWKTFGIRFKNWRYHCVEAIGLSIPVIIVLMISKWIVIHWILKDPSIPLIDPKSSVPINMKFSLPLYLGSLLVYIIIAPLQELIARGALQSGFYVFLLGSEKNRTWIAIIISNLIFSLPHLYESPYFAVIVLVPGIFWGWLFARQKTLVGVSVSHIFIGVWMVFVVGFERTLNLLGSFF